MHKRSHIHRRTALLTSAALLLGCIPAYAVEDGVKPTYDEAYYATTDYYGNLTEGSVVKSYTTNGAASLTDYGEYDEIVNLTNSLSPVTANGKSVFNFKAEDIPAHFYFEGKTEKPFESLPWTLSVHYALNGVATKAEELAGKTGVVEITVDAIPNENAAEYARNNYTLEAMAIFNQDDILSLEAPGAQVQLVGNLRAVLFIALPGEECHFTIRVGSEAFSFGGMTFLMVPATLSQLEEISKLSTRKDDLEDNYDKLSHSLDTLLDSMSSISGSLYATANGLDQLEEARGTISAGKAELYDKSDLVLDDLDALNQTLSVLPGHLDSTSQLVQDIHSSLSGINDSLHDVMEQLDDVQDAVEDLCDELDRIHRTGDVTAADLTKLGVRIDNLKSSMEKLLTTLSALTIQIGGQEPTIEGMTNKDIAAALTKAKSMDQIYRAVGSGAPLNREQFLLATMIAGGSTAEEANSTLESYQSTTSQIEAVRISMGEIATFDAAENYFFGTLVPAQYQQTGYSADEAAAAATQDRQTYDAGRTQIQALEATFNVFSTNGSMNETQFFAALIRQSQSCTNADAVRQAEQLMKLLEASNNLTKKVEELSALLGSNGLSGHTASLLLAVGSAISRFDDVVDETNGVLDRMNDALDTVDDLHDLLGDNVPELRETLTSARNTIITLSTTITDTSDFLGAFKTLLQTSGTQLDAGTQQTLEGLAESLRATARSLNTTGDVKTAKNTINGIIEDTWKEYTGEVNNLLLMDATASAVSLTDERNDAPQSIQVLIRTQEIQPDSGAEDTYTAEQTAETTFWGRVAQMFQDLWSAVTGIFGRKD